jgi:hypothetical protein
MLKKRRTREHVIADLGVHHVEGVVLECGWTTERIRHDYGYDLAIFTYTEDGFLESGLILVQVKATENLTDQNNAEFLSWTLDTRDIRSWRSEIMPVAFVVCDTSEKTAYWVNVQDFFADKDVSDEQIYMRCRIPRSNRWDVNSLTNFRNRKRELLSQMKGNR